MIAPGRPVLAIETSGRRAGAAIAVLAEAATGRSRILASGCVAPGPSRGEALADCVASVLQDARLEVRDLHALAVVHGPGSYTAIRVGLALTRGLALIDRMPVVGVGSLELLALAGSATERRVCCLMTASAGRFYAAAYERRGWQLDEIRPPQIVDLDLAPDWLEQLAPAVVCAERLCLDSARPVLEQVHAINVDIVPDERVTQLADAALVRLAGGAAQRAADVLPVYLLESSAKPNRNRVVMTHHAEK